INRELADLKACLNRAFEWGIIEKNPLERVKLCKLDNSPKVRYLSLDEEKHLREALDKRENKICLKRKQHNQWLSERKQPLKQDLSNTRFADYLKPVVLLSINTGLRRGEVFGLKWVDIDWRQKLLTVTADNSKSNKTRYIPLNDEAFAVLN